MTRIDPQPSSNRTACLQQPRARPPADVNESLSHWLETQRRVVEHWRERLVAEAADPVLIGALDQHAAFLRQLDEL